MMHTLVEMFHCGAAQPKRTGIRSVRLYRVRDLNESTATFSFRQAFEALEKHQTT
jgi:hypothetical protein